MIPAGPLRPSSIGATAATNRARSPGQHRQGAGMAEWLGHANIATTRIYDQRNNPTRG
jgi:site-specific recombinase XerC